MAAPESHHSLGRPPSDAQPSGLHRQSACSRPKLALWLVEFQQATRPTTQAGRSQKYRRYLKAMRSPASVHDQERSECSACGPATPVRGQYRRRVREVAPGYAPRRKAQDRRLEQPLPLFRRRMFQCLGLTPAVALEAAPRIATRKAKDAKTIALTCRRSRIGLVHWLE